MMLLSAIGGFFFGAWLVHQWGNHRAKYYRKQMKKALLLASKTNEANKLVVQEYENLKKEKRVESINTMRMGLLDGIADLAKEGL